MGFDDVTARFVESPKRAELVGKYLWRWSATLEIEFEQMLPPGWAELLPDFILYSDIFDKAMNREWPEAFIVTMVSEDGFTLITEDGLTLIGE